MRALISRYPDFYAGSPEFVDLQDALEPETLALWTVRDGLMDQLCVNTATWGLRYWEQTLGIPVEQEKALEYRRSRIRSKLRGSGVTTVALIESVAESFSNGDVAVTEDPQACRLEIKFVGTVGIPPNLEDLTESLREILPAHLAWDYVIVFNTWNETAQHTWDELRTRSWDGVKGAAWA